MPLTLSNHPHSTTGTIDIKDESQEDEAMAQNGNSLSDVSVCLVSLFEATLSI